VCDENLFIIERVLFNWQQELEKFAPQLQVYTYYQEQQDLEEANEHDIILSTYGLIQRCIPYMSG